MVSSPAEFWNSKAPAERLEYLVALEKRTGEKIGHSNSKQTYKFLSAKVADLISKDFERTITSIAESTPKSETFKRVTKDYMKNTVTSSWEYFQLSKNFPSFVNEKMNGIEKMSSAKAVKRIQELKNEAFRNQNLELIAALRDIEVYLTKRDKVFYKLRFIPTGKFYKPSAGYSWEKNNLSPTGKVYSRKAINFSTVSRIHVQSSVLPDRKNVSHNTHPKVKIIETLPEEWEWVEFEIKQTGVSPLKTS